MESDQQISGAPGAGTPRHGGRDVRARAHVPAPALGSEQHTRRSVARILLEEGPVTASEIAGRLDVSAAGVRRHLDALVAADEAASKIAPARPGRGRGRPARRYGLTSAGRSRFGHAYDDLAVAALRQLRELGGDAAVAEFARRRVEVITTGVRPVSDGAASLPAVVDRIAEALTTAGYAASTRQVGSGVQLCQHHCPVAHVAAEFPQLCDAERSAFAELLGTHVQRLATIANGDSVCTTHVPVGPAHAVAPSGTVPPGPRSIPRQHRTDLRKELA